MHSANLPDKAAKTSGNASTADVSYRILHYFLCIYAFPAWEGFLSVECLFQASQEYGYMDCVTTVGDLIDSSDYELFEKVCSTNHSLYHLLPPYDTSDLRLQGDPFQLPEHDTDLHEKLFVVRSLYEYIK